MAFGTFRWWLVAGAGFVLLSASPFLCMHSIRWLALLVPVLSVWVVWVMYTYLAWVKKVGR